MQPGVLPANDYFYDEIEQITHTILLQISPFAKQPI